MLCRKMRFERFNRSEIWSGEGNRTLKGVLVYLYVNQYNYMINISLCIFDKICLKHEFRIYYLP